MFDFERDEAGSHIRYAQRLKLIPDTAPRIKHWGWWWVHNCISHPLIGVCPIKMMFDFHDWTSKKLNAH